MLSLILKITETKGFYYGSFLKLQAERWHQQNWFLKTSMSFKKVSRFSWVVRMLLSFIKCFKFYDHLYKRYLYFGLMSKLNFQHLQTFLTDNALFKIKYFHARICISRVPLGAWEIQGREWKYQGNTGTSHVITSLSHVFQQFFLRKKNFF